MPSSATHLAIDRGTAVSARGWTLAHRSYGWCGTFGAMASPCEVHVAGTDRRTAEHVVDVVAAEARRIEHKYSRYRRGNVVDRINSADGRPVRVDPETARLLSYADELFELSKGCFDITSGLLRRAWRFDGGDTIPSADAIARLLPRIGWDKARWRPPVLTLRPGMEIDLGGIGKEYAVDRAGALAGTCVDTCLINFGGDLLALGAATVSSADAHGSTRRGWTVGIEGSRPLKRIELARGALATSGDAHRFVCRDGHRYGHVLDARTGWPVEGAPRSVTVAAPTCTQAGMLATFAMLMGADAERFLADQAQEAWCLR